MASVAGDPPSAAMPAGELPGATQTDYFPLQVMRIHERRAEIYVAYGDDDAVLGICLQDGAGRLRYLPVYASTYRGLPAVTLEVLASTAEREVWLASSWPQYDVLAYLDVETLRCVTWFGEVDSLDRPIPDRLVGKPARMPPMDRAHLTRVALIEYDPDRP